MIRLADGYIGAVCRAKESNPWKFRMEVLPICTAAVRSGGVVNLHTTRADEAFANGEVSYGSLNTPDVSFAVGAPLGNWTISAMGQAFQTGATFWCHQISGGVSIQMQIPEILPGSWKLGTAWASEAAFLRAGADSARVGTTARRCRETTQQFPN